MIKPYSVTLSNGQKYFIVNPEYLKLFESLGIDSGSMFFRADPFSSGLHGDTNEDEPHFQYFQESFEYNFEIKFVVKKNGLPLLNGHEVNTHEAEIFFETLETSIEYILESVSDSNEWAKENYMEAYLPNLQGLVAQYRLQLEQDYKK